MNNPKFNLSEGRTRLLTARSRRPLESTTIRRKYPAVKPIPMAAAPIVAAANRLESAMTMRVDLKPYVEGENMSGDPE